MKTLKDLQTKVNEISNSVGGLKTEESLRTARRLARQSNKGLVLEIIQEALTIRWRNEQRIKIGQFVASAN